jgi:hypothetical protein
MITRATREDWLRNRLGCLPGEMVRRLVSMQKKGGERVKAKLAGKRVLIFSREHNAFWGSNGCGYVQWRNGAGVYRFEDAWRRTNHCGPEKKIIFVEAR